MAIDVSNNSKSIKHSFPATLENVDKTAEKIKRFLKTIGIKEQAFSIILGMREALINAVTHGSGGDRKKTVNISLKLEGCHLIIEVGDEGKGFDWRSRLGRELPSREESGRGLAIMKGFFTNVEFNERGNRLILMKKI